MQRLRSTLKRIKENLKKQLTGSVNWLDSVLKMQSLGVDEFYEVGPKNVLKGLIERTIRVLLLNVVRRPFSGSD